MVFHEYGKENHEAIIFIHGFLAPWQVLTPQIDWFSKEYHIIVPVLDGHNPEDGSIFSTIPDAAKDISDYYVQNYGTDIFAVFGMSMGGAIASSLWMDKNLKIRKLFLEAAPLVGQPKMLSAIILKQYISLTHKTQRRHAQTLKTCEETFMPKQYMQPFLTMVDAMSDESIRNSVVSTSGFRLPADMDTTHTEIMYCYGTTLNEVLSKKSARYLKTHYKNAKIVCKEGYAHCELSLRRPLECNQLIDDFLHNSILQQSQ